MELFLYQDNTSLFLKLLSNYVNAEKKNIVKILSLKESTKKLLNLPEQPFLVTSKNETINDEIHISQIIANFSGRTEDLFGEDFGRIETNINFIKNSKKKCEEPIKFLEHLDSHLLFNTFVNGFHISVSDIYAYSQIICFLKNMSSCEKNKFNNILRWVNHLQSLENLRDTVKEMQLNIHIPFESLVFIKEENVKCNLKNNNNEKKINCENVDKKPVDDNKQKKPKEQQEKKTVEAKTEETKFKKEEGGKPKIGN